MEKGRGCFFMWDSNLPSLPPLMKAQNQCWGCWTRGVGGDAKERRVRMEPRRRQNKIRMWSAYLLVFLPNGYGVVGDLLS